jgi:hypothetical protein
LEDASEALNSFRQYLLRDNVIIETYEKQGNKNEKPMANLNLFRLFEDVMDKKLIADETELAEGTRPQTMPEFLMSHLNGMFGLKKLAIR